MGSRHSEDEEDSRDRIIVFLRHGRAEDARKGLADEERPLTPEGHAEMMKLAAGVESAFPRAQIILSSPLVRAVQTALWISKAYRSRIKITETPALIPSASPEELAAVLRKMTERRIIVVGHEPNLTANMVALVGLANIAHRLSLKKGGCYAVRVRDDGDGALEWLLSPRILRKLAES
jgi:phosphohistidine phosphatase